MELKVLKHVRDEDEFGANHKALIEVLNGYNGKNKEELVEATVIKAGCTYQGNAIFGYKVSKSSRKNQYIIVWESLL